MINKKIEKIYLEIANKELSFGCIINRFVWIDDIFLRITETNKPWILKLEVISWNDWKLKTEYLTREEFEKYVIKGHPVMIWDMLDWYKNSNTLEAYNSFSLTTDLLTLWKYKRLSIEEQSEECIDYIYNLLPNE